VTAIRATIGPMRSVGVHHVSINVQDVDEACRFYVELLGLSLRTDRPDFGFAGAWLDAGDQQVHLIHAEVPASHGQHFALWVEDLDAAVTELRGRGVEVRDPSPVGAGRQTFVTDPSGNVVELHEPPTK
jgi:glyoxylase I family protein